MQTPDSLPRPRVGSRICRPSVLSEHVRAFARCSRSCRKRSGMALEYRLWSAYQLSNLNYRWIRGSYQSFVLQRPGRARGLRPSSPLRTVRESFPSYGSSISKAAPVGRPECYTSRATIARYARADSAPSRRASLSCRLRQKYSAYSGT